MKGRRMRGKAKAAVKGFLEKAGAKMKPLHYEASAAEALQSNCLLSEKPAEEVKMKEKEAGVKIPLSQQKKE